MRYDLLIKNGTIVDGTGQPAFKGDVAVSQGRIAGLTADGDDSGRDWEAERVLRADGLTVAPGFIDIHSHSDFLLPHESHPVLLARLLEQGVTTVVAGNCGFSPAPLAPGSEYLDLVVQGFDFLSDESWDIRWDSMDSFLRTLEDRGVSLNLAQLAGHRTLRWSLWGRDYNYPGRAEMARMEMIVEESLEAGAFGLSFGLGYEPGMFVEMRELETLAECVKRGGGILTVHLKALSRISPAYKVNPLGRPHNLRALEEMIAMAEKTGVKLQISHLLFAGRKTWPTCDSVLEMIEQARSRGLDIAFDSFPYTCGNTTILIAYPAWFLADLEGNLDRPLAVLRLRLEWSLMKWLIGFALEDMQLLWGGHPEADKYNGKFFTEIGPDMGCSPEEAYIRVTKLSNGKAACLLHTYSGDRSDEEALQKVLAHPLNTFETDAIIAAQGMSNPAAYGTFPRIIQRYHKELGLLSLEEAVAGMTGKSARRVGISDRGTVEVGQSADLTLFDYEEIRDNTTLTRTEARPSGIRHVFLNGEEVVRGGEAVPGKKAGQVLRRT